MRESPAGSPTIGSPARSRPYASAAVARRPASFGRLLDALARPGEPVDLGGSSGPAGAVPGSAARAVLLALADPGAPLWLEPRLRDQGPTGRLLAAAGYRLVDRPHEARFALAHGTASILPLARFDPGTACAPHASATLVVEVAAIGAGQLLALHGPGVEEHARLQLSGVGQRFWSQWHVNTRLGPCGVDAILTAGGRAVALSRSTRVEPCHGPVDP